MHLHCLFPLPPPVAHGYLLLVETKEVSWEEAWGIEFAGPAEQEMGEKWIGEQPWKHQQNKHFRIDEIWYFSIILLICVMNVII